MRPTAGGGTGRKEDGGPGRRIPCQRKQGGGVGGSGAVCYWSDWGGDGCGNHESDRLRRDSGASGRSGRHRGVRTWVVAGLSRSVRCRPGAARRVDGTAAADWVFGRWRSRESMWRGEAMAGATKRRSCRDRGGPPLGDLRRATVRVLRAPCGWQERGVCSVGCIQGARLAASRP
jgi:hypothetical protein